MSQTKQILSFLIFILSSISYSQVVTQEEFKKIADSFGLNFKMPEVYKEVQIIKNPDLDYSFAMINEDSKMEVRYSIFPLKEKEKINTNDDMISVITHCWFFVPESFSSRKKSNLAENKLITNPQLQAKLRNVSGKHIRECIQKIII